MTGMRVSRVGAAIVLLFLAVVAAGFPFATARADDAGPVPAFIRMFGEWESVGVRAEPPSILVAMPNLKAAHRIIGAPTGIEPGVRFMVEQTVAGKTRRTELTYVFDAIAGKSFGVIVSDDGAVLRGVIEHHEKEDVLKLYDADNNIVWAERNVWASPDLLKSEATFTFQGEQARAWFETSRKTGTTDD